MVNDIMAGRRPKERRVHYMKDSYIGWYDGIMGNERSGKKWELGGFEEEYEAERGKECGMRLVWDERNSPSGIARDGAEIDNAYRYALTFEEGAFLVLC